MGEPNNPPLLDSQQDPNQAGDATVYGTEITLRDLFAGMAMQGLIASGQYDAERNSQQSWRMADTMMQEREK